MTIDNELIGYCAEAKKLNSDNLMKILRDNENTQYGQEHDFCKIKSMEEYRKTVPLSNYSSFEKYIERMREGEENVLTVYPLAGFCRTSGSTGRSKYIPLSYTALKRYSDYFERWRTEYLREAGGKRFLINAFRTDINKPQARDSLFTEFYYRYIYEQGFMDMAEYIGGELMIFADDDYDILYLKVREALCYPDIKIFESIYMYELLNFFSYLESNWESMINDMEKGSIPADIHLSQRMREYILSIKASDERISEIKKECKKGFKGIAKRLWKHLSLISGISCRSNIVESAAIDDYTGNIKKYFLCYCSSECYIGTPIDTDDYSYVMMPQNAFYEFLPNDEKNDETFLPHELTEGRLYEPVITNFSGLYRYKTGDVVKITGFVDESPIMEFMFRKGQALNIAGEKYDVRQLEKAVFDLRSNGIIAENYCFSACYDTIPGCYKAVLALYDTLTDKFEISELLDKTLCLNNSEYEDLRKLGELGKPEVIIFDSTEFAKYMEGMGLFHTYGHNKPHHLLKEKRQKAL